MKKSISYHGRSLSAYRASLHIHSTMSDGEFSPSELIAFYAEAGYDILAFTDHGVMNPVSTYDPQGMTLLSGMEIHPQGGRFGKKWHLLALGLPETFPNPVTSPATTIQECIDAVLAVDGVAFCAHPAACGFRSCDIAPLKGLSGLEVFNSDCRFFGRGYSTHIWNELADDGMVMNAIAVDDMHGRCAFAYGWTMVLTDEPLSQQAVIQALRRGDFYATQGPEIHSIALRDNVLEAEFSPCVEVVAISNFGRGYTAMCENFTGPEAGFQEVAQCRIRLKDDNQNAWVRLQLKDRLGHYAWSNPILVTPN